MPRSDDDLLSAYLDGVAELTPEERKRVEATLDPTEAAATRKLLGALRALPAETSEPDWAALERSISRAVGPRAPQPWWRRSWKWALPVVACAGAALAIAMATRPDAEPAPVARVVLPAAPAPGVHERAPMVYLDGEATDIDAIDPAVLDDQPLDVADEDSLLPTDHWVDQLDDRAVERAERWLAKRKKS